MYNVQWKINILKSFRFSLPKKKRPEPALNISSSFRSNFKSAPAPAKKPRLRLRNTAWIHIRMEPNADPRYGLYRMVIHMTERTDKKNNWEKFTFNKHSLLHMKYILPVMTTLCHTIQINPRKPACQKPVSSPPKGGQNRIWSGWQLFSPNLPTGG